MAEIEKELTEETPVEQTPVEEAAVEETVNGKLREGGKNAVFIYGFFLIGKHPEEDSKGENESESKDSNEPVFKSAFLGTGKLKLHIFSGNIVC